MPQREDYELRELIDTRIDRKLGHLHRAVEDRLSVVAGRQRWN